MRRNVAYALLAALSGWLACSGGGGTEPEPKPPVILSGPSAGSIAVNSATIEWTTDKISTSTVRYGETASYGDSVSSSVLVSDHSVNISGLEPVTLYHYEVSSEDGDGRSVTSLRKTFTTLSPAGGLVEEGWDFFEAGDVGSALTKFEEAYSYEPQNVSVLEGLGWALLMLYRFEESLFFLEAALSSDPDRVDCLVAIAFLHQAREDYDDAIEASGRVITIAGDTYEFEHDAEITSSDVRYCLILSLAGTGDFTGALEEAKILDPAIDLDPGDPSTWDGYLSFEEALLMLIENLKLQV